MKQSYAAAAVLAVALLVGSGSANAASLNAGLGGDLGIQSFTPWAEAIQEVGHKKKHKKKHHKHKNKHRKHKKHGHRHHKHNNGGFFLSFGSQGPVLHYNRNHSQSADNCRGVVTDGYYHGRYAKLGATLCYDRAGNGYIVDGSRYLIHYY